MSGVAVTEHLDDLLTDGLAVYGTRVFVSVLAATASPLI